MVEKLRVLIAGDHFVTPELVRDAIAARVGDSVAVRSFTLPGPQPAAGPATDPDEAAAADHRLIASLAGVELAVTRYARFTERVLAAAPQLRLLVVCRSDPANVDRAAAERHRVAIRTAPGWTAVAAAEHTVALLLSALRQLPDAHAEVRDGQWRPDRQALDSASAELAGTTVGVIGYGAIGSRVGRLLRAFDAEVLVADPYADPARAAGDGARLVPLPELLARATVVSLHARLTPETRGMIGAAELAALPRGAVLVNTARGGLLDYAAVVDALESGQLGAAGLDVFDVEPLPAGSRLRTAPRVVLTPHLAAATRQAALRAAARAADAVADHLRLAHR
jgi:D-3-phosphoglycerate dehydrogenase